MKMKQCCWRGKMKNLCVCLLLLDEIALSIISNLICIDLKPSAFNTNKSEDKKRHQKACNNKNFAVCIMYIYTILVTSSV